MQATEPREKPVIVVKLGGSMIDQLSESFYESFIQLSEHYHCVIVHGGGPAITSLLNDLGIKGEFYDGLRKTTAETLDVVMMTLGGKVSNQVTSSLARHGRHSIGLKGSDGGLIQASLIDEEKLGFVGQVEQVKGNLIKQLLDHEYIPVIAPLARTSEGQLVNVNADAGAAAVANALNAEKLLFVTDVAGIIKQGKIIDRTTPEEIQKMIEDGDIYGGMIPKVTAAISALSDDLQEVLVVSGERSLIEGETIKGTTIYQQRKEEVTK